MDIILRSVQIIDPSSPHHGQTKDILIKNGTIRKIGTPIKADKARVYDGKGLKVSPGWFDLNAFLGDPGFEYKEDIQSGMAAAAAGGFTGLACLPNTHPVVDSKSAVEYVVNKSKGGLVDVYPYGAVSEECKGKDITEIYDMHESGAVAFTDGLESYLNAGLMERALFYVKPFDGVIISFPDEKSVSQDGHMNEGEMSTSMGLQGIPALAEELIVSRDIELAEYTGSRVHFAGISTAGAVELVRKAKKNGIKVSCSVAPFNVSMDDSLLADYDTNLKVLPPLRGNDDIKALLKGLKDGTIDALCSGHVPQDEESKKVEFDYAAFGMITLETAFSLFNKALGKSLDIRGIVDKLVVQPRKILGLDAPVIAEGEKANLTVFDDTEEWVLTEADLQSKSRNTPLLGQKMVGRVKGIVNNNKTNLK